MTKPLNEYTIDELLTKIRDIKAERQCTAYMLQRYEEELERKKQEFPLGVPLEGEKATLFIGGYPFGFASEQSEQVFYERIKFYAETLQKLATGEPIDIHFLLPLLRRGYVVMDKDKLWFWYKNEPIKERSFWNPIDDLVDVLRPFHIKPVDDWKNSLMECGL